MEVFFNKDKSVLRRDCNHKDQCRHRSNSHIDPSRILCMGNHTLDSSNGGGDDSAVAVASLGWDPVLA